MLATFFYQFSIQAVNPLMNGYARNLGINSTFAGIIVGAMSITSMLLRPFAGNLTDQVSKYRLALVCVQLATWATCLLPTCLG
ncbi:hypothetical protein FD07_GL001811 [Levilactobacillus parabrevis ATCC 53295]|uniref:Major facilitator superfamily (MFS) profile domain-containing protein n=1 Tax=Levilactobacillus parabrevis ATCC 53295 TaxID=1267003 RepID=A0A0R1GYD2_9LACO|nr:hypothetical protein FD07_GL001811 [Levilactobacillus parabrevis ATCC 53295]